MRLFTRVFIVPLVLLLFFWIYKSWFFSPIIAAGDFWYYFPSMFENYFLYPYAWDITTNQSGLGVPGFVYQNGSMFAAIAVNFAKFLNLGWGTSVRILFYIPFMLLSFGSSIFFIKKVFPNNKIWFISPIIFSINTYILMIVGGGQIPTALSYTFIPLTLYFFIKLAEKVNSEKLEIIQYIIFCSLLLSVQALLDLRIAFVTSLAILVYLLFEFWDKGLKIGLKTLIFYSFSFIILALINSYWIIPVIFFGINPIEQLGIAYSSSGIVEFLSFARLENSISLSHPYWPENIFGKVGFMKPEFLLLPILAFSSLFFVKKNNKNTKCILHFALIGLVGIFLGKGASEPFGNLYIWMFDNIPGFQLFRDSFKWYVLTILSYSILIPFTIQNIYDKLKTYNKFSISPSTPSSGPRGNFQFSIKSKFFNLQNLFVFLFIIYLLFLIRPALFGQLPGTFQVRSVPDSYVQLDKFLSQDKSFYRTLWIPNTMLFGHYTNIHRQMSGRDFFKDYDLNSLASTIDSPSSQEILEEAGVKYVIIPEDTESQIYLTDRKYDENKYMFIVNSLSNNPRLEKINQFGKVVVYKTPNHKDHFWCECDAKISYEFINPTKYKVDMQGVKTNDKLVFSEAFDDKWIARNSNFKIKSSKFDSLYNSFELSEGDYELEIYYSPQDLVDLGVKISLATITILIIILVINLAKKPKK